MKIGIEAQRLFRKRKHGIELVAVELIKNLQVLDKVNEYFIFIKPDEDSSCIRETENFNIIQIKTHIYPLWEQVVLPQTAKKLGCDILHCTSNTAPIFTNIPVIVTLHDIIYLEKSYLQIINSNGTSYQKYGNIYRRFVVPRIVVKAKKIITVSHSEKSRILEYFSYGVNDSRMAVVYNGVGKEFTHVVDLELLNHVKELYRLPDSFILFLGNTDEKKNTNGVLKAYSEFLKQSPQKLPLVIPDFKSKDVVRSLASIGNPEIEPYIHLIGYVPNHYMPGFYNLCTMFLYPSLRESFGIPILEAMKSGKPVITSNTSSMPEVSGGNAILVDPYKPEEITNGMLQLINDKELYQNLVKKGCEQAEKFTWEKMAEDVLFIYNQIATKL